MFLEFVKCTWKYRGKGANVSGIEEASLISHCFESIRNYLLRLAWPVWAGNGNSAARASHSRSLISLFDKSKVESQLLSSFVDAN